MSRGTSVHRPENFRRSVCDKTVESLEPEARILDQGIHLPVYVASAAKDFLNWVPAILPFCDVGFVASAMFDEQHPSAGLEHTMHFAKCCSRVGNRAERPGNRNGVEPSAVERQDAISRKRVTLDREGDLLDALADFIGERCHGIERMK